MLQEALNAAMLSTTDFYATSMRSATSICHGGAERDDAVDQRFVFGYIYMLQGALKVTTRRSAIRVRLLLHAPGGAARDVAVDHRCLRDVNAFGYIYRLQEALNAAMLSITEVYATSTRPATSRCPRRR